MKKTYIAPSLVCVKMEAMQVLATSLDIDKNDTTDHAFSEKKDYSEQIWGE